jgi:hypothetical protein
VKLTILYHLVPRLRMSGTLRLHGVDRESLTFYVFERPEVHTAALLRIKLFWDVMVCRWASFRDASNDNSCLHV